MSEPTTNGSVELTITLPAKILQTLIFSNFDELAGVTPKSCAIGDTAKVKVIPHYLGEFISQHDKDEHYFHVAFCSDKITKWAELWTTKEWRDSNAKFLRSKEQAQIRISEYEQNRQAHIKRESLIELLEDNLGKNYPNDARKQLAEMIADNYKKRNLTNILETLNLLEVLNDYERICK